MTVAGEPSYADLEAEVARLRALLFDATGMLEQAGLNLSAAWLRAVLVSPSVPTPAPSTATTAPTA